MDELIGLICLVWFVACCISLIRVDYEEAYKRWATRRRHLRALKLQRKSRSSDLRQEGDIQLGLELSGDWLRPVRRETRNPPSEQEPSAR
jgi:hypothetical protein